MSNEKQVPISEEETKFISYDDIPEDLKVLIEYGALTEEQVYRMILKNKF